MIRRLRQPVMFITKCKECDFILKSKTKKWYCGKGTESKPLSIPNVRIIPDWCPLITIDALKAELAKLELEDMKIEATNNDMPK